MNDESMTLLEKVQLCLKYEMILSDWEGEFIQDIENRLLKQGKLSANQKAKVEQIYEKVR